MKNFKEESKPKSHTALIAINLNSLEKWKSVVYYTNPKEPSTRNTDGIKAQRKNRLQLLREIIVSDVNTLLVSHFQGSLFLFFLLLITRFLGVPTIVKYDVGRKGLNRASNARKLLLLIEGILADKILVTLDYKAKIVRSLFPLLPKEKFFVIPRSFYPLPPEQKFKIGTKEKDPYLLAVSGHWSDIKNLHTALDVFSEVLEEKQNLEFWIVGKFTEGKYPIIDEKTYEPTGKYETGEQYKRRIKKLIRTLGIEENVRFLGIKTGEDLKEIYRSAKVYYLPTKNDLGTFTFLESMAAGTPIVSTNHPGVGSEIIKEGRCGFLRDTKKGQKKAVLKLLKDEKTYYKIQENCLKEARKYTWENLKEKWRVLLQEVQK